MLTRRMLLKGMMINADRQITMLKETIRKRGLVYSSTLLKDELILWESHRDELKDEYRRLS